MTVNGKTISDLKFMQTWDRLKSASLVSEELGLSLRNTFKRRRAIEREHDLSLKSLDSRSPTFIKREHMQRADCEMENGVIMVGSDVHIWPGEESVAQAAFRKVIKQIKPQIIVLNGDVFDGAQVSRWPKSGYGTRTPTVKQELDACRDYLDSLVKVSGGAKLWWTLGNHDLRYESRLANTVPEFEGVAGFSLKEHFPEWSMSISLFVNKNLMILHNWHNGIHATYNNALKSGVSVCTGHLHRLQASSFSDYNGTRFGIDTGTLGETSGDHMSYGQDRPMNHCSGFAVLTVVDGQLVHPEFCAVLDGVAYFRGKEVAV